MTAATRNGSAHDVLYFSSRADLVDSAVPFLSDGLAAGESAVLACGDADNLVLREALNADLRVRVLAREGPFRHATEALAAYQGLVREEIETGSRRVRLLGGVGFGERSDAWTEWTRFEALCNVGLSSLPLWNVCAYDSAGLPADVLAAGTLTHPYVLGGRARQDNPRYVDPHDLLRRTAVTGPDPLEATPPHVEVLDLHDLLALRHLVRLALSAERASSRTTDEFVLALSEVATNGIRHGVPPVHARMWITPERVLCTVTDHGAGFDDPVAGYLPRSPDELPSGGMGLWMARQLVDRLDSFHAEGVFTVRLISSTDAT